MRKDGSVFLVEISLSAIPAHQGILVAGIVRDVTGRRFPHWKDEATARLRNSRNLKIRETTDFSGPKPDFHKLPTDDSTCLLDFLQSLAWNLHSQTSHH